MTPTEYSAKTSSPRTSVSTTVHALLHLQGSGVRSLQLPRAGAPKVSPCRSFVLAGVVIVSVLGLLAFSAPALAAAPETPETVSPATAITATSARLHGVLNPGKAGEPGSYQFSYAPSASECAPGTLDPEAPALAMGAEKEEKSVTVTGLEPNREYAFCIVAYSLSAQPSRGAAVPFKTLALAPAVTLGSERASEVTSTGARLEAQVNPNNEATSYVFEYSTSKAAGKLMGTIVKVADTGPINGFSPEGQTVGVPTEALKPGTTYFYRVVAENEQSENEGKPVGGPVQSFTTVATPQTEAATSVTATTATFHGTLKPLNETVATEYSFHYGPGGCMAEGGGVTTPGDAGTGKAGEVKVSVAVSELQPDREYSVCLVSINAFGAEVDPASPPVSFMTLPAPPKVDGEGVSGVTPVGATLEAQVNPNNQRTTYFFEYAASEAQIGTPAAITLQGEFALPEGFGDQTASVATRQHLAPATPYFYRVVAENAAHEKTEGKIEEFKTHPIEPPIVESESTLLPPYEFPSVTADNAALTAQVGPNYVVSTYTFQYAESEAKLLAGEGITVGGGELPAGSEAALAGPVYLGGVLAPETTYFYRVVARNEAGVSDGTPEQFTTLTAPVVTTAPAQNVIGTTATLSGTVNPLGVETSYHYAYIDQQGYEELRKLGAENPYGAGLSTPEVAIPPEVVVGPPEEKRIPDTPKATEPLEVSDLAPGTVYHYAVIATNVLGITMVGPDRTFTTGPALLPTLGQTSVSNITQSTATITGSLNPQGTPVRWELRLGGTPGNLVYRAAGRSESTEAQPLVLNVEHLAPGSTYYYRFTAANPDDQQQPAETPEASFTTNAAPAPPPLTGTPLITPATTTRAAQETHTPAKPTPKPLTNAEKLAKALKACHAKHGKKRAQCEAAAHKKYPAKKKRK